MAADKAVAIASELDIAGIQIHIRSVFKGPDSVDKHFCSTHYCCVRT